jgi:peptidyl-prolyl cis-trans isomerase A (cyclophilin A)
MISTPTLPVTGDLNPPPGRPRDIACTVEVRAAQSRLAERSGQTERQDTINHDTVNEASGHPETGPGNRIPKDNTAGAAGYARIPGMTNTLTATLNTNQGPIKVRLFPDQAPETVRNFVELAEGSRKWQDPRTGAETSEPLYNGTIFHRVIPDFMIQGGDPLGTGTGGPGYKFKDEIHPDLAFTRPYLLAMANAGPGTNGSQFFITVTPTTWLTGKHTIFGEVIEGADLVQAISQTQTDRRDRPTQDVVIESVVIDRDGDA